MRDNNQKPEVMKTIAQQLGIKDFPFIIRDKDGNKIYWEDSIGYWVKKEYNSNGNEIYSENSTGYWVKYECDSNGNVIYWENSNGDVVDNRPKPSCEGKVVEIDGKKYQLKEIQ